MSKKITFLISISIFAFVFSFYTHAVEVSAKRAVVIECQSGDIVFQKDAHSKAPMASTTKIMTAILAIENCGDLDKVVTVNPAVVGTEGSSIYLQPGEKRTMRELLYALMLESANDAAAAIAYEISGDIPSFAELMNQKVHDLGLQNTHFSNPHGLDSEEHYTTAYDLAMIARYAMQNHVFSEIVSTRRFVIPIGDGEGSRVLSNHNKLLYLFDGANGVKTGFTRKSGRCLVSSAEKDGVSMIAVTLDAPSDWSDHKKMLNEAFLLYENRTLADIGDYKVKIDCINGVKPYIIASNLSSLNLTVKKSTPLNDIKAITEYNRFLCAPINKGDCVGKIVFYLDDKEVGDLELYADESVNGIYYKKSFIERIFSKLWKK